MTNKERRIEQERVRNLPSGSKERTLAQTRLSCTDMIDSILCYRWDGEPAETILEWEEQNPYNYLADYYIPKVSKITGTPIPAPFGRQEIINMIRDQMADIKVIHKNTYKDPEGCIYNGIEWKDEPWDNAQIC